ncbi:MAG: GHKL domain-containing protein [Clostridia bacterium]|nr:GHKL domain-containing protein [Clostridia bacterium]
MALLDQFRFMAGTLGMLWILCCKALPQRERFRLRSIAGSAVCLLLAFCYVPLHSLLQPYLNAYPILIGPYWLFMNAALVTYVLCCYDTGLNTALYYMMITSFTENIVTVVIRNLFVYTFFPAFPERHPGFYLLMMLAVYAVYYAAVYTVLEPRIRRPGGRWSSEDRASTWLYLFLYVAYILIMSATKNLLENVIQPLTLQDSLLGIYRYLQLFLSAVLILLSVVMTSVMWYIHQRMALQTENEIISRLAKERQAQYEFSKENIDMINQKSHDLKHQLQALAQVSDEERRRAIQETSQAIDFYDAIVKTGNEALDTLLTEKSVYCKNRGIRLSCMVNTENLKKISLVDLYTLLGNALDNAIESVERVENPERKIISLSILDRGNILYIQLENYFDGHIQMEDGLPQTRKKDKANHGYGLKSIHNIVRNYSGQMEIHTDGDIFFLEAVIPT